MRAGVGLGLDPRRTPLSNASMRQQSHRLRNRAPDAHAASRRAPGTRGHTRRAPMPAEPPCRAAVWPRPSEIDLERLEPPPGAPSPVLEQCAGRESEQSRKSECLPTKQQLAAKPVAVAAAPPRGQCEAVNRIPRGWQPLVETAKNSSEPKDKERNGSQLDPGAAHAAREPLGGGHLAPI